MSFKIITSNADETKALGKKLGSLLKSGDCVLLDGELGAGKTTFTQGFAKGLGIKEKIQSPTFVIKKIYHPAPLLTKEGWQRPPLTPMVLSGS